MAVKVKDLVEELNNARVISFQASYASQLAEKEYQVSEQARYLEEANALESQVRDGSQTLLALDDQIGELQKQIEELTGGESKGLNKIIFDLHLKIDTNKDKIADAESKDLEDKQEVEELSQNLESAQIALQEFVNTLDTAKADLASSEISLNEAQQEELAVQAIMESSGDESAKLSQQLTRLLNELNAANEVLAEAQNEVNKTAITSGANFRAVSEISGYRRRKSLGSR